MQTTAISYKTGTRVRVSGVYLNKLFSEAPEDLYYNGTILRPEGFSNSHRDNNPLVIWDDKFSTDRTLREWGHPGYLSELENYCKKNNLDSSFRDKNYSYPDIGVLEILNTPDPNSFISKELQGFKILNLENVSQEQIQKIFDNINTLLNGEIEHSADEKLEKPSFKTQLKSDAINAAYRIGSKQLITLTKNIILQQVRLSLSEESKVKVMADLLETEVGTAITTTLIGIVVSRIPQLSNSPKINRILKEFRVSGMTTIANSTLEALVSGMLPVITLALNDLEKGKLDNLDELDLEEDDTTENNSVELDVKRLRQS